MRFGRIHEQQDEVNCSFKEKTRVHGNWYDVMALREEFVTAFSKMIAFPVGRFFRTGNNFWVPCFQQGGFLRTYQMASGSNPVDLFGWEDDKEDLLFSQDTSLTGQLAQKWELRMLAQGAALKEVANG